MGKLKLSSVILANGFTSPYIQMGAVAEYACRGPYPLYDDSNGAECEALETAAKSCQAMIKQCYDRGSKDVCGNASIQCWTDILKPVSGECLVYCDALGADQVAFQI